MMAASKQIGLVGFVYYSVAPKGNLAAVHRDYLTDQVDRLCPGTSPNQWFTDSMENLMNNHNIDIIVAIGRLHAREAHGHPKYPSAKPVIMGPANGDPSRYMFSGPPPSRVKGVTVWNRAITPPPPKTINQLRVEKFHSALAGKAINSIAVILYRPSGPNDPPIPAGSPGDHEMAETRTAILAPTSFGPGTSVLQWRWHTLTELQNFLNTSPRPDAAIVLANFPNYWSKGPGGPGSRPMIAQWAHDNRVPTLYPSCDFVTGNRGFMSYGPRLDGIYDLVAQYVCEAVNGTTALPQVTEAPPAIMECCYSQWEANSLGLPAPAGCTPHD
jgi:hypothetical protein